MPENQDSGFKQWSVLELMGHRRLGGLVTEALIAGAPFIRIDIHILELKGNGSLGEDKITTQYYSPGAVYAITPCEEAAARAVARYNQTEPVHPYELPQLKAPEPGLEYQGSYAGEEDEDP